jgi:hypothetical protein
MLLLLPLTYELLFKLLLVLLLTSGHGQMWWWSPISYFADIVSAESEG